MKKYPTIWIDCVVAGVVLTLGLTACAPVPAQPLLPVILPLWKPMWK
jgi:predicted benzoate:H+ symporter BenE